MIAKRGSRIPCLFNSLIRVTSLTTYDVIWRNQNVKLKINYFLHLNFISIFIKIKSRTLKKVNKNKVYFKLFDLFTFLICFILPFYLKKLQLSLVPSPLNSSMNRVTSVQNPSRSPKIGLRVNFHGSPRHMNGMKNWPCRSLWEEDQDRRRS